MSRHGREHKRPKKQPKNKYLSPKMCFVFLLTQSLCGKPEALRTTTLERVDCKLCLVDPRFQQFLDDAAIRELGRMEL